MLFHHIFCNDLLINLVLYLLLHMYYNLLYSAIFTCSVSESGNFNIRDLNNRLNNSNRHWELAHYIHTHPRHSELSTKDKRGQLC